MLLTVIIPTRNRANHLLTLLDSLSAQHPVDFKWEVLVVDNGSEDHTITVCERKAVDFPVNLRCVSEEEPGLHRGRNRGAKEAQGKILGYLDDDMQLAPTWLQGVRLIRDGKADAVVGRIKPYFGAPVPDWADVIYDGKNCGFWGLIDLGDEPVDITGDRMAGGNSFIGREMVLELGGFNPDGMPPELLKYRGDGETGFYQKFERLGKKAMYDPVAEAIHIIPAERMTMEYICKRSFLQGISDSYTRIRKDKGIINPTYTEINDALIQGMLFHRNAVQEDPELLRWVLKKDYF